MKIVSILGSPRAEGNSAILAEIVCGVAEQHGAKVSRHYLNRLNYKGCQACSACKGKSDRCILQDDLREVLEDVIHSDVVLLASPVFWGEVTGQMKLFIDRTYSFLKPGFTERSDKHRLPPGKKLVWIQVQGAENKDQFGEIFHRYNVFFQQLNFFSETHLLRACGVHAVGAVNERPDLIEQARTIGKRILS